MMNKLTLDIPFMFLTTLDAVVALIHLAAAQRVFRFSNAPSRGLVLRIDFSFASRLALAPTAIFCLFVALTSKWWSVICLIVFAIFYMAVGIGIWVSVLWASGAQACLGLLSAFILASVSKKRLLHLEDSTFFVRSLFPVFGIMYFLITVMCIHALLHPK
jgi:hypothetical protein